MGGAIGEVAPQKHQHDADDRSGWLELASTALTGVLVHTGRARDLALQGISSGRSGSGEDRAALAAEVDAIRLTTIGLTTTTFQGRPLFAGAPLGAEVFGTDDTHLFAVLADIAAALRHDPSALPESLTRLDAVVRALQAAARAVRPRTDRPRSIIDLQLEQASYQVALASAAKVIQPSLTDFLR
ncbi:MAG TPA: hypothetical protein VK453_00630 [Micromonosporaceae bacterium]|nr:hypothetical protein [Micromonosporaceae bacterium]